MDRLSAFIERRRALVIALWLTAIVAAIPFSLRQTDHLTSGGFVVPGSGSQRADEAIRAFPGVQGQKLAAVLDVQPKASQKDIGAAVDPLRKAARRVRQ